MVKRVLTLALLCAVAHGVWAQTTYTASFADGNDNTGWTIDPTSTTAGSTVTVSYSGGHKVKSVTVEAKPSTVAQLVAAVDAADASALATLNSDYRGTIIGSDGMLYATASDATDAGTTASAIIVYLGKDAETNETYNHGLALALTDASTGAAWCSQTDTTCLETQYSPYGSPRYYTDMAGIANTDGLVGDAGHTHAAASAARSYGTSRPSNTSDWFLPSAGQWYKMINAAGYSTLKTIASMASAAYWSSTEWDHGYVYGYEFRETGEQLTYPKNSTCHVRLVLAF